MNTRRALSIVTLTVFVAASSIGYSGSALPTIDTSLAACGATLPSIEVEPKRLSANEPLKIYGRDFARLIECNDANMGLACQKPGVKMEAMHDVSIELVQGTRNWRLATVDPDQDYAFDRELRLPDDVAPGEAFVIARGNYEPAEATVSIVE